MDVKRVLESESLSVKFAEEIASKGIEGKIELREWLSTFPTWDEDRQRLHTEVAVTYQPSLSTIRERYRQALRYLINSTNPECYAEYYDILIRIHYRMIDIVTGEDVASSLKDLGIKTSAKAKLSRTMAKIFEFLVKKYKIEVDKHFNQLLTVLYDSFKAKSDKHTLFISINPADFLSMSNGNGWQSCHRLGGDYASGTLSYAFDGVTLITYIAANSNHNDILTPKLFRQVLHITRNGIIFSRIYGFTNPTMNERIQEEIVKYLNLKLAGDANCSSEFFRTKKNAPHYPDYEYVSESSIQTLKEPLNITSNIIGSHVLCIACGETHYESRLLCDYCNDMTTCYRCNNMVHSDDTVWIDGELYCLDCSDRCNDCGEWVLSRDLHSTENGGVCSTCYDDYEICYDCDTTLRYNNLCYIEDEEIHLCEYCNDRRE